MPTARYTFAERHNTKNYRQNERNKEGKREMLHLLFVREAQRRMFYNEREAASLILRQPLRI